MNCSKCCCAESITARVVIASKEKEQISENHTSSVGVMS